MPIVGKEWSVCDKSIFVLRLIVFCLVSALLFCAMKMESRNIAWSRYRDNKRLLVTRRGIICFLILLSVVVGAFSIWELCSGNPNEWLGMKISFYIFTWIFMFRLGYFWSIDFDDDDNIWTIRIYVDGVRGKLRKKIKTIYGIGKVLSILGIVATIGFFLYGLCSPNEKTTVEQEVVSSTKLVAANDSWQTKGKLTSSLLATTFTISDHGVYRYYFKDEDGYTEQDYVDASETKIDYIKDGETPHLDLLTSYTYITRKRNNKPYVTKYDEETWYILYIPEGSLTESYVFDLQ